MIKLQDPSVPQPTQAVEIDKAISELQVALDANLNWLTHDYGRAYRFIAKGDKKLYFPEVYIGGEKRSYHVVSPDNDKKGTCFFVVGREDNKDFDFNQYNYLEYNVGIVFWVNLELINGALLDTEYFTQNLIKDVRDILTRKIGGLSFALEIENVVRGLEEIYREFRLDEKEGYLRSPYSGFRFNCKITLQEDCGGFMYDRGEALKQNISENEILSVLLPKIDFSQAGAFNSLTAQQKLDIQNQL